ncbi:MAG: hypothetical protein QM639_14460 [Rhodocyclaceae bacterium]
MSQTPTPLDCSHATIVPPFLRAPLIGHLPTEPTEDPTPPPQPPAQPEPEEPPPPISDPPPAPPPPPIVSRRAGTGTLIH